MSKYVDGFLLIVPKKNLDNYRKMSRIGGKVWREHGALEYRECVGDEIQSKFGVPFGKLLKVKPGELVVFSWIVYKSKKHRNSVNAKVMKDPRLGSMMGNQPMPFDMKRMSCGGFQVFVDFN